LEITESILQITMLSIKNYSAIPTLIFFIPFPNLTVFLERHFYFCLSCLSSITLPMEAFSSYILNPGIPDERLDLVTIYKLICFEIGEQMSQYF
jgi:hypothetical protein